MDDHSGLVNRDLKRLQIALIKEAGGNIVDHGIASNISSLKLGYGNNPEGMSNIKKLLSRLKKGDFLHPEDEVVIAHQIPASKFKDDNNLLNFQNDKCALNITKEGDEIHVTFIPYKNTGVIISNLEKAIKVNDEDKIVQNFLVALRERLAENITLGIIKLNATGSFSAEFSREPDGLEQLHKFFDKINAGGFLRKEDIQKLRSTNDNGPIYINNDHCSMDIKREGNIALVTFNPKLSHQPITTLDQAIKKIGGHNQYKKSLDKFLPRETDSWYMPSEPPENFAEKHKSRHLPEDAAYVSNHLIKLVNKEFPGSRVKVDFSISPQKAEPEFTVILSGPENKSAELAEFLRQIKSEWNSANIKRLPDSGNEMGFCVSASPSLLKALIKKSIPDSQPQTAMTR